MPIMGDALILCCNKSDKRGVIVIDGGPSSNPRFNHFEKEVENCLPIDLMILAHFDDDHLVRIKNFIERHQNDIPFPVKRIWANCAKHVDFDTSENSSSSKASKMADLLCVISQKSELDWEAYRLEGFVDDTIAFADIDIINPRKEIFKHFIENYKEEYNIGKHPIKDNLYY